MSSSDATALPRRAVLLAPLALAACGFAPVYGSGGGAADLRGAIAFSEPRSPSDFVLEGRLQERLGAPVAPRYRLQTEVTVTETPAAFAPGRRIVRYTIDGTARFALATLEGAPVISGTVTAFTAYSATGTSVANLAAEDDARHRLSVLLADQIVTRILAAAP